MPKYANLSAMKTRFFVWGSQISHWKVTKTVAMTTWSFMTEIRLSHRVWASFVETIYRRKWSNRRPHNWWCVCTPTNQRHPTTSKESSCRSSVSHMGRLYQVIHSYWVLVLSHRLKKYGNFYFSAPNESKKSKKYCEALIGATEAIFSDALNEYWTACMCFDG